MLEITVSVSVSPTRLQLSASHKAAKRFVSANQCSLDKL